MKYKGMQLYCAVYEHEGKMFARPFACDDQNFTIHKLDAPNCLGIFKLGKSIKFNMDRYIEKLPQEGDVFAR